MIIAFEGIDGCGKGTQIDELSKIMGCENRNYPDRKGMYGRLFDNILKGRSRVEFSAGMLFAMFLMDMAKDKKLLEKYRDDKDHIIVLDRYAHSTLAYQSAQGVDYESGKKIINEFGLARPDIVFIIDITPEESMRRIGRGREIFEKEEFLRKARENYKKIYSEHFFADKMYWLSGMRGIEEISREIIDIITEQ